MYKQFFVLGIFSYTRIVSWCGDLKILVLAHGLTFGGAQIATLEYLELLRSLESDIKLRLITCSNARKEFFDNVKKLNIVIYQVPCRLVIGYPVMVIKDVKDLIKWADLVWISDIEYSATPEIKGVREVPIVAHLHSYALLCPQYNVSYGDREVCLKKCSLLRIIKCKQLKHMEYYRIGLLSNTRARFYWLLDFAKGPLDFAEWKTIMKSVLNSIDGFIPVSNALWKIHVKRIPELYEKPHVVVYNPVTEPLKYVKPDPNEPYGDYILYASGSNPVKGPHVLLDAWSIVSREFRDLKLYMIGCKGSWVEKYAKRLGLNNVVFLYKQPPNSNYYETMYRARAVVMPSIVPEAFGRIPVEANRLGVPAIVSDRGALPEIIENGITGIVSEVNSHELANAIMKTVSFNWDRGRIMESISKRIDPESIIDKLLDFLMKMVS